MTTNELKSRLHQSIDNINDDELLLLLKEIAEGEKSFESQTDPTLKQLNRIEEAEKQIEEGKYLTNEEADRLVEKWLNQ
jgi:dsDNA-specific endonuclease/ATPase MutS2